MIDLHTHTSESDGTSSPEELTALAAAIRLEVLAITDHDTLAGFDRARPLADELGLELLCGIEVSTKFHNRSVHLLGYFPAGAPGHGFRDWILRLQDSRDSRNQRLLEKLNANGIDLSLDDFDRRKVRKLGRPHIAMAMLEKGYVQSLQQAFDDYLADSAPCYVDREEASFAEAVERIKSAGGISSLPHPYRVTRDPALLEVFLIEMRQLGLSGLEVYNSDHSASDVAIYAKLAEDLGLITTGGSDFHGAAKPGIELGTGKNKNLNIPLSVVEDLRASVRF
jgi:predicted metal-dependent phosphoesterase TrpH